MSKGKYKRKRERKNERAQQNGAQPKLLSGEGKGTEHNEDVANSGKSDRNEKKEVLVRLRETIKRSSFSDWCLVAFTCALAFLGYFQYKTMDSQLDVMPNDERAWIGFKDVPNEEIHTPATYTLGQDRLSFLAQYPNTGKTPAKNIHVVAFVDIIPANQEVPLDFIDDPSAHMASDFVTGMESPGPAPTMDIERRDQAEQFRGVTVDELKALYEGKAYIADWGIIRYDDVFGRHHWNKWCRWSTKYQGANTYNAKSCTQFNSIDE